MLTYFQAIFIGLLQGVTELFPVSSLGHSVVLPPLVGWNIDQNAPYFLVFLVATHIATSLVLLGFFRKDWVLIVRGIFRSLAERYIAPDDVYARLGWLIVVATVPAGMLGILFEKSFAALFAAPVAVSIFLALNGVVLYGSEVLRGKNNQSLDSATPNDLMASDPDTKASGLTWSRAVKIGFAQALALLPGFSRTGSALAGGLLVGLDHESSARFAFLLATPIIFAAGVLKLPELIVPGNAYPVSQILVGAIAAAIGAYFSVRYLTRYFQTKTLKPFAIYCLVAGVLSFAVFILR
ncbi:MAG: undecaprenyl-diphosphate phosphatase [Patescibacteria group bacterium]|nr:undecaprenyl-diphosphate phosphatase [Patescibacteria group bacterium]